MIFVEKQQGDIVIISLRGKLIGSPETDQLTERIKSTMENKSVNIVIDLRQVNWISSLGIGAIMRNITGVRNAGGDLRLAGLGEKVKDLFSITKLIGVIQTFQNINEAVESFSA